MDKVGRERAGCLLLGLAVGMFGWHLGMAAWQYITFGALITFGLGLLFSHRKPEAR